MRFPIPSRETTPSEYAVLVWFFALGSLDVGTIELLLGIRAPAENHDVAVELEQRGGWCMMIGLGILLVYWIYRRLKD